MPPRRRNPALPLLPLAPEAPIAIVGPPSPLVTPWILRQIFLYSTNQTLARCMRTSQEFYHVAAPILYRREIRCPDIDLEKLALGHNRPIRTRTTRKSGPSINLKRALLQHIRILELGLHVSHRCQSLRHLPRLQTFRIRPRMWCPCLINDDAWLFGYPEMEHLFERIYGHCAWYLVRADKVVMACYSGSILERILARPRSTTDTATTITVILSPDSDGCDVDTAQIIRDWLEGSPCEQLRIIIAPPTGGDSNREDCYERCNLSGNVLELFDRYGVVPAYPEKLSETALVSFCRLVTSPKYATAIYLIHGHKYRSRDGRIWRRSLPSLAVVEERVRAACEGLAPDQIPNVVFKSRKDYIDEGVVDEIDASELATWRCEEAKRSESENQAISGGKTGSGEGSRG